MSEWREFFSSDEASVITGRVVKWHGLSVDWPRDPTTLDAALYRIAQLQQAIYWMRIDLKGNDQDRRGLEREIRHYENLLTARWNANDARAANPSCDCGAPDCITRAKASGDAVTPRTSSEPAGEDANPTRLPSPSVGDTVRER